MVGATRVHTEAREGRQVARGWRVRGWRVKGPRVSGPSLGVWGSNANALCRPTFSTYPFSFFLPSETMFPGDFKCAGDVVEYSALDASALN